MNPDFRDKEAFINRLLPEYEAVIMGASSPHTNPIRKLFPLQLPPTRHIHTHNSRLRNVLYVRQWKHPFMYSSLGSRLWTNKMEYDSSSELSIRNCIPSLSSTDRFHNLLVFGCRDTTIKKTQFKSLRFNDNWYFHKDNTSVPLKSAHVDNQVTFAHPKHC